jgi:type VI secretion system secreted protein VgrG
MSGALAALSVLQSNRLFKFHCGAIAPTELLLNRFKGEEALSRIYTYEIELLCEDAGLELKALIGQLASIEVELADRSVRYISGHISAFASEGSDGGMARYKAELVPWLWICSRRTDARIFQDVTVEEVVRSVFGGFGTLPSYEFRVQRTLKTHSYITQYQEDDMAFVQRLLEAEGLFFYFAHDSTGHRMIISDDSTMLPAIPETPQIRFHSASVTETSDAIIHWRARRSLQPSHISTQTFDYRQPQNSLPIQLASRNDQGAIGVLEQFESAGDYTHADYTQGEAWMLNRLEALEAQCKRFTGLSNCRAMRPGSTFELTQHYDHDFGAPADREFVLLSVLHIGNNNYGKAAAAHYSNEFSCIRKKIPFRPQRNTAKPLINGPQTAIVVGPPGEEIYTDDLGRIKVQFHWDRYGEHNEKSSCWVRVVQSGASGGFGAIQLPRVGDEVVVSFINGDPNRPLVTGSVYNSRNTPPWSLPANKTQSGFLTRSLKGDGGTANFFRFEDKPGCEQVSLHAERNLDTSVEVDETLTVGQNRMITVGGTHSEVIKNDTLMKVTEGSFTLEVDEQFIQIKANQYILLKVGGSSIRMTPGKIELRAEAIQTVSTGLTTFKGAPVEINGEKS